MNILMKRMKMKLKKNKKLVNEKFVRKINNAKVFNLYNSSFFDELQEDLVFCNLLCGM